MLQLGNMLKLVRNVQLIFLLTIGCQSYNSCTFRCVMCSHRPATYLHGYVRLDMTLAPLKKEKNSILGRLFCTFFANLKR